MNAKALKTVLLSNAVFSLSCAVVILALYQPIAQLMGSHPTWLYIGLGLGLLIFAADVAFVATREKINPTFAKMILWADIGWVVGSVALLALGSALLSEAGMVVIALIAGAVGILGYLEYKHIYPKAPANASLA